MPFSHRASETAQLLKQMTPYFIPPTLWPPKSPHLNPKEYAVWGIMQFTRRRLRTASADCGGMGTTRPACDWQCGQTVVQETTRLCRCRWWTVWTLWLTFWLPQWTSLSFLKCLTTLYRLHCKLFSVVFASADWIVHCKEYLLYIPQSPMSVESAFSSEYLLQILCKLAHNIWIIAKNKRGCFFTKHPVYEEDEFGHLN